MFRWYVVNTYSGHENKVKQNLEHRVVSLGQQRAVKQVVVPTETVSEMKENQKVTVEKRTMPGYVLVNMELNDDSWTLVKGTPGVTGFVGASNEPVPLTQPEVDRLLHREVAQKVATKAQFSIGESVKVVSGPLSDFSGEISEINDDAWTLVKGTPGVTGFVGASNEPVPLTQAEVDRLLHRETAERPRTKAQFSIGESVKVVSGPLSDFSGEIAEINQDAAKLKVLVSIFGRETPVEVGFDQVKKI